jgi:hypothetical protein
LKGNARARFLRHTRRSCPRVLTPVEVDAIAIDLHDVAAGVEEQAGRQTQILPVRIRR